jgi:hypothetical protein
MSIWSDYTDERLRETDRGYQDLLVSVLGERGLLWLADSIKFGTAGEIRSYADGYVNDTALSLIMQAYPLNSTTARSVFLMQLLAGQAFLKNVINAKSVDELKVFLSTLATGYMADPAGIEKAMPSAQDWATYSNTEKLSVVSDIMDDIIASGVEPDEVGDIDFTDILDFIGDNWLEILLLLGATRGGGLLKGAAGGGKFLPKLLSKFKKAPKLLRP